jgi:hypothetical protein
MLTHQPDIDPATVAKLITFKTFPVIYKAIADAYLASLAEPTKDGDTDHPIEPQPS